MKRVIVSVSVLALASSAMALPFRILQVDMGGAEGAQGQGITGDFTGIIFGAPVAAADVGARVGDSIIVEFVGGIPSMTNISYFSGVFFSFDPGSEESHPTPAGFDGLEIFLAANNEPFTPYTAPSVFIDLLDAGMMRQVELNDLGNPTSIDVNGMPLSQPYRLAQYGRDLWVEAIPAPGAIALLAPIGLMAARRRW